MKRLLLTAFLSLFCPVFLTAQVILNEVMYAPDPHEPEWVELYNAGTEAATIQAWTIREDSNSSGSNTTPFSSVIPPGSYLVVTADLATFTERWGEIPSPVVQAGFSYLNNNDSDCVRLRSKVGETIDEVCYKSGWGGRRGKSLERRSPGMPSMDSASWGTSIDPSKGTPGRANSLLVSAVPSLFPGEEAELTLFPNPTAEYVHVRLPESFAVQSTEIRIIDVNGALLRVVSASSREVIVPVTDLPSGLYQLYIRGEREKEITRFITVVR